VRQNIIGGGATRPAKSAGARRDTTSVTSEHNGKYCTTYYGFKRMKEEQGLLIQWEKIDAAGIAPVTSR
jgi:hypothetical protein